MNVDVIHKVVGIKAAVVRKRSVYILADGVLIRVMHPLHVLASRVFNLYMLQEKQTELGVMQVRLAVDVSWHYIVEVAHKMEGGQKAVLKIVEEIVTLAKSSAGRFAKLNGADFLKAIPIDAIQSKNFQTIRLPRLKKELERTQPQKNRTPIVPTAW